MSAGTIATDWARVGCGLRVRFTLAGDKLEAEWGPRLPTAREMRRVIDRYRKARDELLTEVARRHGGNVLCVELHA